MCAESAADVILLIKRNLVPTCVKQKLFRLLKVPVRRLNRMEGEKPGDSLKNVVEELENFAPVSLAEKWDNVGLLVEPYNQRPIKTIFLTNDLTLKVLEEAEDKNTDLIISYHPPIFTGLKRITQDNWKEKIVSICLAKGIAVYSPHTAWDCARNGVNDWLASALPALECEPIKIDPVTLCGPGRILKLKNDLTLAETINNVQKHIGLDVHFAMGVNHTMETQIKTAAVCAGSGGSVLKDVSVDVYLSGEMSHHEVLDAQHRNISVILCNHSNSERGFLEHFKLILCNLLNGRCKVIASECDKDPLTTIAKK